MKASIRASGTRANGMMIRNATNSRTITPNANLRSRLLAGMLAMRWESLLAGRKLPPQRRSSSWGKAGLLLLVVFHVLGRPKIKGKNEAAKTGADWLKTVFRFGQSRLALKHPAYPRTLQS
ncbi:MAG: hypothetical protein WAM72_14825 [Xanthobacteraceae bacterium]